MGNCFCGGILLSLQKPRGCVFDKLETQPKLATQKVYFRGSGSAVISGVGKSKSNSRPNGSTTGVSSGVSSRKGRSKVIFSLSISGVSGLDKQEGVNTVSWDGNGPQIQEWKIVPISHGGHRWRKRHFRWSLAVESVVSRYSDHVHEHGC